MASLAINQRKLPSLPQSGWIQNIWEDIGGQWHTEILIYNPDLAVFIETL